MLVELCLGVLLPSASLKHGCWVLANNFLEFGKHILGLAKLVLDFGKHVLDFGKIVRVYCFSYWLASAKCVWALANYFWILAKWLL